MIVALGACITLSVGNTQGVLLLLLTLSCVAFLCVVSYSRAVALAIVMMPLSMQIRVSSPSSILLAGASTFWLLIPFGFWFFDQTIRKDEEGRFDTGLLVVIAFMFWCILVSLVSGSFLDIFLAIRQFVIPCVTFVIVRKVLLKDTQGSRTIMFAFVSGGILLTFFQYLWFTEHITAFIAGREVSTIDIVGGSRSVLGGRFDRMQSLIGGGPSNAGIYLFAVTWIGLGCGLFCSTTVLERVFYLIAAVCSSFVGFYTLSRSVGVFIVAVFVLVSIGSQSRRWVSVAAFLIAVFVMAVLALTRQFADSTLSETIAQDSITWSNAFPEGMAMLVGEGIITIGGGLVKGVATSDAFVDGGWPLVWRMLGIPGLVLPIVLLIYVLGCYLSTARDTVFAREKPKEWVISIMSGSCCIAMAVSSVHTAILVRPVSCIAFYALAAVTLYSANGYRHLPHAPEAAG